MPLAYIRYYLSGDASLEGALHGIETAVADGVDVINMSWTETVCNATTDAGGINEMLQNAANAGVVLVACAGNTSRSSFPGCQIASPAYRPEVIGVGQLYSTSSVSGSPPTYVWTPYNSLIIKDESSKGGVPIQTSSSVTGFLAGVGLLAPGCFDDLYKKVSGVNTYTDSACGTSLASPVVAGMVGLMRNAWWTVGWPRNDARLMMTNALLMGDSWDGSTVRTGSAPMDWVAGAGRPRIHWPSNVDLVTPWSWGQRSFVIHNNETVVIPVNGGSVMPASATQWKWAVAYTWNDPSAGAGGLQNVPDVDFYVDDICGGVTTNLYSDIGYDVRSRFRLTQSQIAGHCLQMRAFGYSVPPLGVTIYSADYYHSGDPSVH